jgi:hypothetical protein
MLYLNEKGRCELHRPERVTITVRELKLKGGLRKEADLRTVTIINVKVSRQIGSGQQRNT